MLSTHNLIMAILIMVTLVITAVVDIITAVTAMDTVVMATTVMEDTAITIESSYRVFRAFCKYYYTD